MAPKAPSEEKADMSTNVLVGFEKRAKELIPGGLASGKPTSDFPKKQIVQGEDVEKEHTSNPAVAKEIAKDHLVEHRDYYTRLKKAKL